MLSATKPSLSLLSPAFLVPGVRRRRRRRAALMESSPETAPPPENTPVSSKPPSPATLQENPSLATAAPPEPAPPDHAAPTPSPPRGQVNERSPEAEEPPALVSIDGIPRGAGPPTSLSPREMATTASPALEAAKSEESTLPSPLPWPPHLVEVSPEAAAAAVSPPLSPQIAEASPEDAPPLSPSPTPQASTSGDLPDASSTDSVAKASEEAARPPSELESMDTDPHAPPAPPTPQLESEPEELLPQQHPRPPSPTIHPACENSEPTQLPPLSPPPADSTCGLPDAAGVTAEEAAVSPPPALEATDGEKDTKPAAASQAFESDAEGSFQEPVLRPPSPPIEAEPSSPEMAPPGIEDFKSSRAPLPAPALPATTRDSLLDAAAAKAVAVMPEEAAGSLPILEAMDAKTETAPGVPPSLVSGAEGALQQPLLRQPSLVTQAEPCSQDMPLPGIENFMSSWLPPPTPLAEVTCASSEAVNKAVGVALEEAVWPVPALEAMDMKTDTTPSLLPPSDSKPEGLLGRCAACSPEMAPPGFENFKLSWPALSTPQFGPAYVLPDVAATEPMVVKLEEAAGPPPALEAMDVDMGATHPLQLPLESGMEGSLQEPQPRPPSPSMQDAPCSPDMAPPGFENFKSSQRLLPSPPLAQTVYTLHDPATTEAAHVSEEAAEPSPALEAMDVNMETSPSLQSSSEIGVEGLLPQHLPRLPSPDDKGTGCSPEMVPSGHENLESLQQLPLPDHLSQVSSEEVHHSPPVLGTMEEGTVPILPPPLESGSEGSLPQLEPQVHSLKAQDVDTPQDAPATNSVAVKLEETAQPPPAFEATDTNMDSATTSLSLSDNGAEGSLPQVHHQLCSPTAQAAPCSLDLLELLPPPPPPFLSKEMGQMVCGSCRDLLTYSRGAVHVQCASCRTINLVLEAHEVGNVHCGLCETLLMYPFGAPAVKCSLCLFVTEIGERNVRPRISVEQAVPPQLPEVTNQG